MTFVAVEIGSRGFILLLLSLWKLFLSFFFISSFQRASCPIVLFVGLKYDRALGFLEPSWLARWADSHFLFFSPCNWKRKKPNIYPSSTHRLSDQSKGKYKPPFTNIIKFHSQKLGNFQSSKSIIFKDFFVFLFCVESRPARDQRQWRSPRETIIFIHNPLMNVQFILWMRKFRGTSSMKIYFFKVEVSTKTVRIFPDWDENEKMCFMMFLKISESNRTHNTQTHKAIHKPKDK